VSQAGSLTIVAYPLRLDDASRNATIALLLCSLMTTRENGTLGCPGALRHGFYSAKAGRRCRLLKPATSRVDFPVPRRL